MTLPEIYQGPDLAALRGLEAAGAITPMGFVSKKLVALTPEEYESIGVMLGHVARYIDEKRDQAAWLIGDWLNMGEKIYGDDFYQVAEVLQLAPQTLTNRRSICSRIPRSQRKQGVTFSTHAEVAYVTPEEREVWLTKAKQGDWSARRLREERKLSEAASSNGDGTVAGSEVLCTCPTCGSIHHVGGAEHAL